MSGWVVLELLPLNEVRASSRVEVASSRVKFASSRGCCAVLGSILHPREDRLATLEDIREHPRWIRGSSRISVHPREDPLHPRECPWILANVRGHPRMSFWNPRGCAECPISGHKHPRECPKSIRESIFDIRESSGDVLEGPNDPREDAKLIREDATDTPEDPRILGDVREHPRMSGDPRGCPWILANVWGCTRMYVMEVNREPSRVGSRGDAEDSCFSTRFRVHVRLKSASREDAKTRRSTRREGYHSCSSVLFAALRQCSVCVEAATGLGLSPRLHDKL